MDLSAAPEGHLTPLHLTLFLRINTCMCIGSLYGRSISLSTTNANPFRIPCIFLASLPPALTNSFAICLTAAMPALHSLRIVTE